jgi:hypothetical protein
LEDIENKLYKKNRYDYHLENKLDENEERKHHLDV